MIKILYLITLIVFSFSACGQDNSVFGRDNINSNYLLYKKNKIKSITEYRYKNEKAKGKGKLITRKLYDTTGMLTEEFSYYNKEEYHRKYEYNSMGYLYKDIGYVLGDPVETKLSYKYNEQGRIIEKEVGVDPLFADKFFYDYDSIGNVIKIKWQMGSVKQPYFYFTDTFEYNNNNQAVKMIRFRPDKSIYFYKTYQYDTKGNLVKEVRLERGSETDVWEYRYDNNNNRIETAYVDKLSKGHSVSKINYNEKGLVISHPGYKGFYTCVYEYY